MSRVRFTDWRSLRTTTLLAACLLMLNTVARAEPGDASIRLDYQYIKTGAFNSSIGEIDIGNTEAHVFMFSGSYEFSEKWAIAASLPWIKKRHQGPLPHNPTLELIAYPEADQSLIDDGNFHSDWQDLYLGIYYKAFVSDRWTLSPFISAGNPTNDYPFYAHAAVGRNLWHVPVGVEFSFTPYFSDFSLSGDVAYVFTEESLGVNIDHWLINLDLAYYFTPGFSGKVFLSIKRTLQGLSFPDDFDVNALNDINWYYHDRTIKHNFVNGGIGFDWLINDHYMLSGSALTMLEPDQVNDVEFGLSLGITRFFRGE